MMETLYQTMAQRRGQAALRCAEQALQALQGNFKSYVINVKKLPLQIRDCGPGNTLANLRGGKDAERHLYQDLAAWLTHTGRPRRPYRSEDPDAREKLIAQINAGDCRTSRRASIETLAFIAELKPLAEMLQQKSTEGE